MKSWTTAAGVLAHVMASPAGAFCSYDGVDYAKTTVPQEFRDSQYVAEVQVLSGVAAYADQPDRHFRRRWGEEGNVALFRLRPVRTYKGMQSATIRFFSPRNSGGFYFERGWRRLAPAGTPASFYVGRDYATDLGGRYLVFLNPIAPHKHMGTAERGATFVNYVCGQSKPWRQVSASERRLLARLSIRHRHH